MNKLLIAFTLIPILWAPPAEAVGPREVIREKVDAIIAVLKDPTYQGADNRKPRYDRLRREAADVFDWDDMARRSLGSHWRTATAAQRKRFVTLFRAVLEDYYLDQMDKFGGNEEVAIIAIQNEKSAEPTVRTILTTHSREKIPIDYHLHKAKGGYKGWIIHDVSIEGISLANNYRQRFSRYLVNHSLDDLLKNLEKQQ